MAPSLTTPTVLRRLARPSLALLAVLLVGTSLAGCMQGPRFQAPFTLANPNERFPIAVHEGEVALDLAVYRGSQGLSPSQRAQLYSFLRDYKEQAVDTLLIRAPSGGPNETAIMHAYEQVRAAMRAAGIPSREVKIEPY